jgi:hypothetical protein
VYPTEGVKESFEKEDKNLTSYNRVLRGCDNFEEKIAGYKQ